MSRNLEGNETHHNEVVPTTLGGNSMASNCVYSRDNLPVLKELPNGVARLIYIDPPFNTGKPKSHSQTKMIRDINGDRVGFKGLRYKTIERLDTRTFQDTFDPPETFIEFLRPRLLEAHRLLTPDGSLYFHIDYREVHYCKLLLDDIFGRESFLNEIIWAYDYGARTRRKWPAKHDNILWYAKDPKNYVFNYDEIDRIPYMAPGLVGPEKAARGKTPTDVWWMTIVSPTGKEKTGYPTQKPLNLLKRIIAASSRPGDTVLDFFAGSGTTGEAAHALGRKFILVDNNPEAIEVMRRRFKSLRNVKWR
jgi:site-specific DNA-methyltransferase (adenine-specific)